MLSIYKQVRDQCCQSIHEWPAILMKFIFIEFLDRIFQNYDFTKFDWLHVGVMYSSGCWQCATEMCSDIVWRDAPSPPLVWHFKHSNWELQLAREEKKKNTFLNIRQCHDALRIQRWGCWNTCILNDSQQDTAVFRASSNVFKTEGH